MIDILELTVYELGIIKNCLRERMITIEEFRSNLEMSYDDSVAINLRIDGFIIDLKQVGEKVDRILLSKL